MEKCNLCGSPINLEDYNMNFEIPQYMKSHHLCFKCAFWEKRLEYDKDLKNQGKLALVTEDWSHWIIRKSDAIISVPHLFGGLYAATIQPVHHILVVTPFSDDFGIYISNNPTHQGIIPEPLRNLYQINAKFLTPQEYKLLQDRKTLTWEYCKNVLENGIF